jgi:hypothetical protein
MQSFSARTHRYKRFVLYSLTGVLVLWATAWLATPALLTHLIEVRGSAALGRALTVGAVDFRPWSLELTLSDLALASADGKTRQLTLQRVYVDAELQSLARLGPVLDAVVVESPTLHLTRTGSGRYDVDDIVERLGARAPAPGPDAAPAPLRFALYNLELRNGAVHFDDQPVAQHHTLRQLHVTLPFLSNLEATRDVTVQPHLAFELNGSAFDSTAQGTPFASTRKGEAQVKITAMDLAPYLAYWPAKLPVQPRSAVLDTDLHMHFARAPQAALSVSGRVAVTQLALADTHGNALLEVPSIQAVLDDVRPLDNVAQLASLEITGLQLWAHRSRSGQLNWDFSHTKPAQNATKTVAASAHPAGVNGQNDSQKPAPAGWQLALAQMALTQGTIHWTDDSTHPPTAHTLTGVALQAKAVRWPLDAGAAPAAFSGSMALALKGKPAQLQFDGQGSHHSGTVHATLQDFALASMGPYLAPFLVPQLTGTLQAQAQAQWRPEGVQLTVQRLALRDTALHAGEAGDWPRFQSLELGNARIDLEKRRVHLGTLALRAPNLRVERDADGQWMTQTWFPPTGAPPTAGASNATDSPRAPPPAAAVVPASAPGAAHTTPWSVAVDDLLVHDGTVAYLDRSTTPRRVRLAVSELNLALQNATLDGTKPTPLTLSARIKAGRTEPGTLAFKGSAMWAPLDLQGSLEARDLPVHAIAPYFASHLNLQLLRADTSFSGQLQYAKRPTGTQLGLQGDGTLEDFRANSVLGSDTDLNVGEELLSWRALNVPGIQLAMAPGTATQLTVREATLSDFFAHVIVNEKGRINLQDLVKKDTASPPPAQGEAPAASSATPSSAAAATPGNTPEAIIQMGPISLVHGKVLFADRFIKPNYTADLSELTGRLGGFSSVAQSGVVQLADLDLRGRAEGTAQLEISGKLNPLAKPLALDIQGRVRGLELPPLSPYAVKYAGYGITRGKLSMDVGYTVAPNGQLTARNQLVLNQLSFGDKVEGAPASLPVKLAVALLADRHGVIDINLPISGSLNDPEFKIGALIFKLIGNLIVKAVSAPFSLLANAVGGSADEMGSVRFAPGSSTLSPEAKTSLDKIAKALTDRPALKMTVTGSAALDGERDALKRQRLHALLLSEKRRRASVTSNDGGTAGALGEAEYPVLLKAVYRRADITKPRNLVGLAKDISVAEMETLLMANMQVTTDAAQALALQRGVAVRDYLANQKLPPERLFLGGAKLVQAEADWTPLAELSLGER